MERLINCHIVTEIECIDSVSGGNQHFEILFKRGNNEKYKLVFDSVWDFRYAIENAFITRSSKFIHDEEEKSNILLVENSEYVHYFGKQVSGKRPTERLKDYIIWDNVDTVIEILTNKEPILERL